MIWLIMGILVLCVLLFVTRPLYVKQAPKSAPNRETADYLEKIAQIDAQIETAKESSGETVDIPVLQTAKVELQRQIIKHADAAQTDAPPPALLLSSLFIIFAFSALGLYALIGRPELAQKPAHVNAMSLEQAVVKLEQKLAQDPQSSQGWVLYARSLMTLRRYNEAIAAYEKTLKLNNNDLSVMEEFKSAKAFIAQQTAPGPTAQQMQDAGNMPAQDRQAMIEGMVTGLAEKLKANPDDPDGWTRLLRARRVLGQEAEAARDIAFIRKTFKDDPDAVEQILSSAGWNKQE